MNLGLDFVDAVPSPVVHQTTQQPGDQADCQGKSHEKFESLNCIPPCSEDRLVPVPFAVERLAQVERGITRYLGMCIEEGHHAWIRREIALVAEQSRVER